MSKDREETKKQGELSPLLLEVLACPKCKGDLRYEPDEPALYCDRCRLRYRIEDGIPIMLIEEAEEF